MFSGNVLQGFAKVANYFLFSKSPVHKTSFFVFFFFPVFNSFFTNVSIPLLVASTD